MGQGNQKIVNSNVEKKTENRKIPTINKGTH
jgi:hypothetical protein